MAVVNCPYCEKQNIYSLVRIEKSYAEDTKKDKLVEIITEYACSSGHTFKTKRNYGKSWYSLFT
jgi:hypothetical protein